MAFERRCGGAEADIPDNRRAVCARRCQLRIVRRERSGDDTVIVPLKLPDQCARLGIPDLGGPVGAGRDNPFAI